MIIITMIIDLVDHLVVQAAVGCGLRSERLVLQPCSDCARIPANLAP
jgi:hypothetical protein